MKRPLPIIPFGRLLSWAIISAIILSPVVVGVFPLYPASVMIGSLLVFSLLTFSGVRTFPYATNVSLAIISACFTVTLFDLIARPIVTYLHSYRPQDVFLEERPEMPFVFRYAKDVKYQGKSYGDLSAVSSRKEWREYKEIEFVTDHFGFRNEFLEPNKQTSSLDLILLGDSFGDGVGTSQGKTWSNILAKDYDLEICNLSVMSSGPWHEYINLSLEIDRLKIREGTVLLWAIFSGNDLDDYYGQYERTRLSWRSQLTVFAQSLRTFRHRSPLRQLFLRASGNQILAKDFLDGQKLLFYVPYVLCKDRKLDEVLHHPNYEHLKATIHAMRKLADEKRLTVAILLVPSKEEVYSWVLNQAQPWSTRPEPSGFSLALKELSQQNEFCFLDLKPHMIAASRRAFEERGALLWWHDDSHWNELGHETAASVVYHDLLPILSFNRHSATLH